MAGVSFLGMGWPSPGTYWLEQRHTCMARANLSVRVVGQGRDVVVSVHCGTCGPVDYVAFYDGGFWAIPSSQVIFAGKEVKDG